MQPDAAGSKVVLSEEDYVAQLRAIIQRDYFPDIPKLTTRLELINALQSHLDSNLPASNPAAPTTPPSDTTLDEFLNTHTSEDNSSFEEILVRMQANHREKFAWSFPKKDSALKALPAVPSGDSSKVLLLTAAPSSDAPSSPSGALVPAPTPAAEPQRVRIGKTEYWPSDPRSSFMFTPHEPIPPPQQEVMGPPKSISRHNTRFRVPPKATAVPRSEEEVHFQQMASDEDLVMQARAGRLGGRACDLDELLKTPGGLSPQVGGCGFVSTPSPAPGSRTADGGSPFYTWGAIKGTPLELPETPLDLSSGPQFRVPPTPPREETAFQLADRARKRATTALRRQGILAESPASSPLAALHRLRGTPLTGKPGTPTPGRTPRLASPALASLAALSPAARRLALRTNTPLRAQVHDLMRKAKPSGTTPSTTGSNSLTPSVTPSRPAGPETPSRS